VQVARWTDGEIRGRDAGKPGRSGQFDQAVEFGMAGSKAPTSPITRFKASTAGLGMGRLLAGQGVAVAGKQPGGTALRRYATRMFLVVKKVRTARRIINATIPDLYL
jgi:hypothetical protein